MSDLVNYSKLLFQILKDRKLVMTTAESCTGGLISKIMTDYPGSSAVFWGSFVTYSNESKMKLLNVDKSLLNSFGAVSKETVIAMAAGAIKASGVSCSVSVSGIAGPDGGTEGKPVGTVWICASLDNGALTTKKFLFKGDRNQVREKTAESAIKMLYHLILGDKLLTVEK